jgi:hypothetical protein
MTPIIPRTLLLFLATVLLSACGSSEIKPTMDYDASYDFSGVKKIALQEFDRTTPASVVVSDMQVGRINEALADELRRRGYEIVSDNRDADMYLVWHLVTQEKTDIRSYNSASYYHCWACGPSVSDVSVRQYTEGTFIVDMVDPVRGQSVWRSIIQSRLKAQPSPSKAEENRRAAARAIFADFPPQ